MPDNTAKDPSQGVKDSDMPPPPPLTHGQVGPSPSDDYINPGQRLPPTGAGTGPGSDPSTGEEVDPGIADAGGTGVGDANTDGATRTGLDPA